MDGIVDAHHHLWDPAHRDYPWMGPELDRLRRRFDLDDLRAETTAAGVRQAVLVQTVPDVAETAEFLAVAAGSGGLVAGVVGWVDLTDPAVNDVLARLRAAPGGQLLVGVRHQVHDEPDPAWIARPDVLRGLAALARHGLAYDLLVRPRELPAALGAARAVPDLGFVVDHGAKPEIATGGWEPWHGRLAALAGLPRVTCKLSGLVTEAGWESWTPAQVARYVEALLGLFGPERLMWGSDWPVCTLAASYREVLEVARHGLAAARLSPTEEHQVFAGTARAAYRLGSPVPR